MLQALKSPLSKHLSNVNLIEKTFTKEGFLSTSGLTFVKTPCRTTFILRRKHPVPLIKKYVDPNTWTPTKKRHKIYELEHYTDAIPEGEISIFLTKFVAGIGEKGELVTLKRSNAYNKLLLPGLAEYASPEAIHKYQEQMKSTAKTVEEKQFSSKDVPRTMNVLKTLIISIVMSQENSWVLEPWHIRASFRKAGVHMLSDDCIIMPKHKIEGPDLNIEAKEFLVTVIINKSEKVQVRCRLHHWHSDILKRIQSIPLHWTKPAEPLFEEEAEVLASMPLPPIPKNAIEKFY